MTGVFNNIEVLLGSDNICDIIKVKIGTLCDVNLGSEGESIVQENIQTLDLRAGIDGGIINLQ